MTWQKYAYNIFSSEGTLIPIEYALECVNNSLPIIACKQKDSVICIIKKPPHDKLQITQKKVQQITNNTYILTTGYESDLESIRTKITEAAFNLEYKLGYEPTADLIARDFADKIQNHTQKSGARAYAFGALIIGFGESNEIYLYYVDSSAVLMPIHAMCVGEHSSKVNGFFEKNISSGDSDNLELSLEGMCQALGYDFGPNEIDMCIIDKEKTKWFDGSEIDDLLVKISEKN